MADTLQLAIEPSTLGGRGNQLSWGRVAPNRNFGTARPVTSREPAALAHVMAQARTALVEAASATAAAAQSTRSMAAALDEVLMVLTASERTSIPAPRPTVDQERRTGALSPREREVLALVAQGRSNKAIAASLFVSPNTVKTHVASLLTKLQADSRVQLAAIAVREGDPSPPGR